MPGEIIGGPAAKCRADHRPHHHRDTEQRETLTAFRDVCWYSWADQTRSMEKLLKYRFEWVLPGHGRIGHAEAAAMHEHLERCVEAMKSRDARMLRHE